MKSKNLMLLPRPLFTLLFSFLVSIAIVFGLHFYFPEGRLPYLETLLYIITLLSVIIVIVIVSFILNKTSSFKIREIKLQRNIKNLTQQINHFRDIADILLESNLWTPGLKEYFEKEFSGLNYFDIKEFYKGRNKLALDYMEQNNRFGETESLYLEIKSLLLNDPSESSSVAFVNPKEYDRRIIQKWNEHHVGNGIYHYFGFKYVNFKEELDVNRILEQQQELILELAIQIDARRYQEMGFSEELLSKLGAHLSEEILPDLLNITDDSKRTIPAIINISFILLTTLIIFGIFQPIVTLLIGLAPIFGFISVSAVLGVFLFLLLAIYPYVTKQIEKVS